MLVDLQTVVTLSYQLFSIGENGSPLLLEERTVDDPLEFLYGQGTLLPKVEELLMGQGFGYETQVELDPRDAFGLHNPNLQIWMPKQQFPSDLELQLGMKFQTQGPDGTVMSVIVKEIADDKVLVDGNHPLAGLKLRFDLKIQRVRKATEEEVIKKQVDPTQLH